MSPIKLRDATNYVCQFSSPLGENCEATYRGVGPCLLRSLEILCNFRDSRAPHSSRSLQMSTQSGPMSHISNCNYKTDYKHTVVPIYAKEITVAGHLCHGLCCGTLMSWFMSARRPSHAYSSVWFRV